MSTHCLPCRSQDSPGKSHQKFYRPSGSGDDLSGQVLMMVNIFQHNKCRDPEVVGRLMDGSKTQSKECLLLRPWPQKIIRRMRTFPTSHITAFTQQHLTWAQLHMTCLFNAFERNASFRWSSNFHRFPIFHSLMFVFPSFQMAKGKVHFSISEIIPLFDIDWNLLSYLRPQLSINIW